MSTCPSIAILSGWLKGGIGRWAPRRRGLPPSFSQRARHVFPSDLQEHSADDCKRVYGRPGRWPQVLGARPVWRGDGRRRRRPYRPICQERLGPSKGKTHASESWHEGGGARGGEGDAAGCGDESPPQSRGAPERPRRRSDAHGATEGGQVRPVWRAWSRCGEVMSISEGRGNPGPR